MRGVGYDLLGRRRPPEKSHWPWWWELSYPLDWRWWLYWTCVAGIAATPVAMALLAIWLLRA